MRFIQKFIAIMDITSIYKIIYDVERCSYTEEVIARSGNDRVAKIYDWGIGYIAKSKERIAQQYDIEGLGLQKRYEILDDAIEFLKCRQEMYLNKETSTKAR